ncbi:hypothetical protein [Saccharopolyspora pogona]|uniref:hypothetical protein n=1 Tax=Saccharopolyspora pogona TaxID=333966 RepID=UPI0016845E20|nr:hypothetical protein [Saccharopolyspora pogona]
MLLCSGKPTRQVVAVDADDLYLVSQDVLGCSEIRWTRTALLVRNLIPYRTTALLRG